MKFMKQGFLFCCLSLAIGSVFSSCEKWKDTPAKDLGLSSRYCNVPAAINYNQGFPGIEDNSTCVYPSTPFLGQYSFRDSIYNNAEELIIGDTFNFTITAIDTVKLSFNNFCLSGNQLRFTANRYYRAVSDSIIGTGFQLMCRTQDTLSGMIEYSILDSSLYIDWTVVSDTGIYKHKGRAYKK